MTEEQANALIARIKSSVEKSDKDRDLEAFVKVFETLDFDKLCLVAAQALIRAAEKWKGNE